MNVWIGISLIGVALLILLFQNIPFFAGLAPGNFSDIALGFFILVSLGAALIALYYDKVGETMKLVGIWVAVFLGLMIAYAYRYELIAVGERVANELLPHGAQYNVEPQDRRGGAPVAVRIRRQIGAGHFLARTRVNGAPVSMIVDTGASSVVLKPEDAARAGIRIRDLRYSVPVQTANGATYAARVRLDSITLGDIEMRRVEALVTRPGTLHQSLLGMSFLSRLRSYEFSGDFLELRG